MRVRYTLVVLLSMEHSATEYFHGNTHLPKINQGEFTNLMSLLSTRPQTYQDRAGVLATSHQTQYRYRLDVCSSTKKLHPSVSFKPHRVLGCVDKEGQPSTRLPFTRRGRGSGVGGGKFVD